MFQNFSNMSVQQTLNLCIHKIGDKTLLLYCVFLVFLCLCYVYLPESIDDAYITLRYSHNLLLGNGPVFNVGEHVEGYSNFFWMILLALFGKFGLPLPGTMKLVSVVSGVVTILLTGRLARRIFESTFAEVTASAFVAISSFFALWSTDGLETVFYTLLIASLLYA